MFPEDVEKAQAAGADDKVMHDTVPIDAAFCMFNRHVKGLETSTPADPADYAKSVLRLAEIGDSQIDDSKSRSDR